MLLGQPGAEDFVPFPSFLKFFDRTPTSDLKTTWTSGSNSAESVCWHF